MNTSFLIAQKEVTHEQVLKNLTTEQKKQLEDQESFIKNSKLSFKKSLTPRQQEILKNKTLSRTERSKLLKNSLTKSQKHIISKNKRALRGK
jgi:hypothetical protein